MARKAPSRLDNAIALAKRRGFVFPCGEIYGGTRSAWDYGPLGVELKENIKRAWWNAMVRRRADVVGLDSSVILPREVWVASGHVKAFTDPLIECLNCHKRAREDQLIEELAETDPDAVAKAASHLNCKDWIRFKLTGVRATDHTEASRTFLDVRDGSGYDENLAADLGLDRFLGLLPDIRHPAGQASPLSAEAAELTGIPAGTPVGVGMIDVAVTGMGLGAVGDGASWLILGTTGFVGVLLPSIADRRSDLSMVLATGNGTQVLEFMAPMTGTPNLDWIRSTLGLNEESWSDIEAIAREANPGAHGVVYLPYASPGGERAPFLDTNASASWQGMSLTSSRADILRSVYEGVVFSLVECIDALRIEGDIVVSGGGFRSDLLCQILADTTGRRVLRQDAPEAGARGAAVLALVSAGRFPDVRAASEALGATLEAFDPHPEAKDVYAFAYDVFRETRRALRPVWKPMRELRKATTDGERA